MKIELKEITVGELAHGYANNFEEGVKAWAGNLDVRPAYQREFVYNAAQREAVIDTIRLGRPLNVMYWARSDGGYEVLDGQQRTISICQYINNDFAIDDEDGNEQDFLGLCEDEQQQILDYKLMVYLCEGKASEKLKWFKTINIAGVQLTDQELRNAVYTGTWLSSAKEYFSKRGCAADCLGRDYVKCSAIRQEYLETALKWISGGEISKYMSKHQHDTNAEELIQYYKTVIEWVKTTFPRYRDEMRGVEWGMLYTISGGKLYSKTEVDEIEEEVRSLYITDDVKNAGIYPFIITREKKYLSDRSFSKKTKQKLYEMQKGVCPSCDRHYGFKQMQADHITPWSKGGKTIESNCQMLCRSCNSTKSNK